MIEDNNADILLIRHAIDTAKLAVTVDYIGDGEAAIAFFDRADSDDSVPCPDLVILDINLPRLNGGRVLEHLRQSRRCKGALVLTVSSSDSLRDRESMAQLGADGYFKKPSEYDQFMKLGDVVQELLNKG